MRKQEEKMTEKKSRFKKIIESWKLEIEIFFPMVCVFFIGLFINDYFEMYKHNQITEIPFFWLPVVVIFLWLMIFQPKFEEEDLK
jgi:hypothetical protein